MHTLVVTFQKFNNWKDDVAIYPENPDDDFCEVVAEIIPNPPIDSKQQIDFDLISAFDRCPKNCAIAIYKTNFTNVTDDDFYQHKHDDFELVYATDVGFPG